MKKEKEFSKILIVVDYLIMIVLFVCTALFPEADFETIAVAWIAQVGVSSAAYYWKARHENKTKVPIKVIRSLPKDVRDKVDLTQVICSIIQSDN